MNTQNKLMIEPNVPRVCVGRIINDKFKIKCTNLTNKP